MCKSEVEPLIGASEASPNGAERSDAHSNLKFKHINFNVGTV